MSEAKAAIEQRSEEVRAAAGRWAWVRTGSVLAGLAVLCVVVNVFTSGHFLTPENLTNVLRQITYNTILGVGQTFVIITAGIDLSVGSMIQLSGVVMALFANAMPFDGALLVVATLVVGVAVGALAGYINALPVVRLNLPPFITTLAMMLIARGLAFKLSHGQPVPLRSNAFEATGIGYVFSGLLSHVGMQGIPIAVLWMVGILIVFAVLLSRTRFGRYVYAIGGNQEAARLAGINVIRTTTLVYVICSACAAVAGFLLMARFTSGSPQTGGGDELLQSIAAVVVGGTSLFGGRGGIGNTIVGLFVLGVLNNGLDYVKIDSFLKILIRGLILLAALVINVYAERLRTTRSGERAG
jgi:ribose transport system permease protein